MPFTSKAQRRWGHSSKGLRALGGPAKVHEWDDATKGKNLPEKKGAGGAAALRATVTRTSNVPAAGKPITGDAHVSYR